MDKKEELLAYFEGEINEVSEKEIAALEQDIKDIRSRTLQELEEQAKQASERLFEQELSEVNADHAIALSHLNDENNRLLMAERDRLVDQIFTSAKEEILAYTQSDDYVKRLKEKLIILKEKGYPNARLFVANKDETLLKELLEVYAQPCEGACDPEIELGGFRLACMEAGVLIDETYDTAILEARKWFCDTSGLTIR